MNLPINQFYDFLKLTDFKFACLYRSAMKVALKLATFIKNCELRPMSDSDAKRKLPSFALMKGQSLSKLSYYVFSFCGTWNYIFNSQFVDFLPTFTAIYCYRLANGRQIFPEQCITLSHPVPRLCILSILTTVPNNMISLARQTQRDQGPFLEAPGNYRAR